VSQYASRYFEQTPFLADGWALFEGRRLQDELNLYSYRAGRFRALAAVFRAAESVGEIRFVIRVFKEVNMTRSQMLSRTMGALGGAALLAIAALVACGGPVPIPGSSSLVGSGGSQGTHTDLGLTTSPGTSTNPGSGGRLPSGLPRATPTTHL